MKRRRRGVSPFLLALCAVAAACKKSPLPVTPPVWDEAPHTEEERDSGELAPAWPAPTRQTAQNGLVQWWLHEPGAATSHVRLLLPLHDGPSSETVVVVAEAARYELQRRLGGRGVTAVVEHGPSRLELVLHTPTSALPAVLERLAATLATEDPSPGLVAAQKRLAAARGLVDSTELAIATLVAQLLPEAPSGFVDPAALADLGRGALVSGWQRLLDPRLAVLFVHAGTPVETHAGALQRLEERWRGRGRGDTPDSAVARLRPPPVAPGAGRALHAGTNAPPLRVASTPAVGGGVIALGCLLPTPRPEDRTYARLAQRIVQEELDVRLTIAGDHALWIVVVPLSGTKNADAELERALDHLGRLSKLRQPRQRLIQAAQLWLGARMVRASLGGEDWTALWSESLDLADSDEAIQHALGRDARRMIGVDPDALATWQHPRLDPRAAVSAWQWVVAGAPPRVLEGLQPTYTLERER